MCFVLPRTLISVARVNDIYIYIYIYICKYMRVKKYKESYLRRIFSVGPDYLFTENRYCWIVGLAMLM